MVHTHIVRDDGDGERLSPAVNWNVSGDRIRLTIGRIPFIGQTGRVESGDINEHLQQIYNTVFRIG